MTADSPGQMKVGVRSARWDDMCCRMEWLDVGVAVVGGGVVVGTVAGLVALVPVKGEVEGCGLSVDWLKIR